MPTVIDGDTGVSQVQNGVVVQADLASGVAGTGPAFFADGATGASLTAGVVTKVTAFTSEVFDTNSNFDTANSRFTPTVAGYYTIASTVRADASTGVLHIYIYKNGAAYAAGGFQSLPSNTANNASTCSTLMYMNGTTDYVEVYIFSGSSNTTNTGAGQTWFSGVMVRAA